MGGVLLQRERDTGTGSCMKEQKGKKQNEIMTLYNVGEYQIDHFKTFFISIYLFIL